MQLRDLARYYSTVSRRVPLQQHPAYGLAMAAAGPMPMGHMWRAESGAKATALSLDRTFFGLVRARTLFRGPVWSTHASMTDRIAAHRAWRTDQCLSRWRFHLQMPEETADGGGVDVLAAAGARRVMTGFATIWLTLGPNVRSALDSKWRNILNKAEKSGLDISIGGKRSASFDWLLEREKDQRAQRGYQALPLALIGAYRAASMDLCDMPGTLSVTAVQGRNKVAGALFLIHGQSATYHIGWSGEDGRRLGAQNLVLWRAAEALAERGVRYLDLGGINSGPLAGITRFKMGMGGEVTQLIGTYV